MSRCNCNFLRRLWSLAMSLIKTILLLGSLLILILFTFYFISMIIVSRDGMIDLLPRSVFQLKVYAVNLSIIIISIIGVYGSLYTHHRSLKIFSILTAINTVIIMYLILTNSINTQNEDYFEQLETYKSFYKWERPPSPEEPKDFIKVPTLIWDGLQNSGYCCGLKSYKEWDLHRPLHLSEDLYPRSCCHKKHKRPHPPLPPTPPGPPGRIVWYDDNNKQDTLDNDYCRLNEHYFHNTGCYYAIIQFEDALGSILAFYLGFQLFLALLATCILCHGGTNRDDDLQTQQVGGIIINDKLNDTKTASIVPSTITLYPNLNDTPKKSSLSPPPRYGAL